MMELNWYIKKELEKVEMNIMELERRKKLLEQLADESDELKLELIGVNALLSLYKNERKELMNALI